MYTKLQKILHWVMGFLIIGLLIVGFNLKNFPDEMKGTIYMLHKSLGVVVLILIPIRLFSRFSMQPVRYLSYSKIHQILMKLSVLVLYFLMFGMAMSGFLMSMAKGHAINFFGIFDIPSFMERSTSLAIFVYESHFLLAPCFVVLLGAHILAALYHHFILKDDALKRMM